MAERRCGDATAARAQVDRLVRWVVRTGGPGDEIVKAETLLDKGAITQAGFDAIRVKALS